ncbi:BrnA antitoxin family protein [Pararhizobium sp. DWP3-4]|uniref:BrnA antitoxin family protein n=1 Tax=Pararhizobium sp. DWP3-4 TaxID=2804565 RepID=UPI003CF87EA9
MAGRKAKEKRPYAVAVTTAGPVSSQGDRVQEVLDYQATKSRRQSYPKDSSTKLLSIRIDADVYDYFQNLGGDWKSRINETLRKATGLDEKS